MNRKNQLKIMAIEFKTPKGFAGALGQASVEISGLDPQSVQTVDMYESGGGTIVGSKRFKGQAIVALDLTSYALALLEIAPTPCHTSCEIAATAASVALKVRTGGKTSPVMRFIRSANTLEPHRPLGADIVKPISWSESDQTWFTAEAERVECRVRLTGAAEPLEMVVASGQVKHGVSLLHLNMGCIAAKVIGAGRSVDEFTEIEASIKFPDTQPERVSQRYRITEEQHSGVRLCWADAFGGMSCFTFPAPDKVRYEAGRDGSTVKISTLVSQYQPCGVVEWLSGIVSSTGVWIYDADKRVHRKVTVGGASFTGRAGSPQSVTLEISE